MNDKLTTMGAAAAAFTASLCCLGPLVLGGLGIGAVLTATFTPLRPYFLTASAVLLALGFYFTYRKPKAAEACDGAVCAPDSRARRLAKPLLWLATVGVVALALFPYYGGSLVPASRASAPPVANATLATAELQIRGMVCEACAGVARNYLLAVPGVSEAEVHYPAGHAVVKYDPSQANPDKLIQAVDASGYKASLLENKTGKRSP